MATDHADSQGDELPPGSTLCGGQYTIDRYLNAGGFGVTYLARDSLGRRVVIKECFPSAMCFRANQTVRVRSHGNNVEFSAILDLFEKEARALASLQHPYIVGVHQYFRDNGTAYMAMDFVEGRTLLDIIERNPRRLTPEAVKSLLTQLLQAVSYFHRNDILHRDISPDNILIDDDNLPVLIDFGAAREDATRVSRVLSQVLTVKDGYSPQEFYLAGSDQVFASDLYALAATFYHVLTAVAPPGSQSRMAAVARNAPDPLRPLERLDGYDNGFLRAINKCLSLFPKDRLQTAEDWQEAIDQDLRRRKQLQRADRDRNLDRTIAELVQEFFKDFQPSKPARNKPSASIPKGGQSEREPAQACVVAPPEPMFVAEDAGLAFDDPDTTPSFEPVASPQSSAEAAPDVEQPMAPIEKMRLKYMKPPEPEDDAELAPRSGWFGLFSKSAPHRPSRTLPGQNKSEEQA